MDEQATRRVPRRKSSLFATASLGAVFVIVLAPACSQLSGKSGESAAAHSTSPRSATPLTSAPSVQLSSPVPNYDLKLLFRSETGNIACDMVGSIKPPSVTCEIRDHSYQPPVKPNCDPNWANRFTLTEGEAVTVNCYPGSYFQQELPVQEYARPLTIGFITCVLDEIVGVTCKDASTGHQFQAARQTYALR